MHQWFGFIWLEDDDDDDMPIAIGKVVNRPVKPELNFAVKFNAV